MNSNKNNTTPEVSIDEALELFIAITYPQGIPEDVDKNKLFSTLKTQIAQDRPEWAAKSNDTNKKTASPASSGNYKEIKEAIIAKSNESDVPEDPEDRYLYERKQKALENLEAKKAEEKESTYKEELRKRIIEKNRSENVDEDFLNKTLKIKLELQKKLVSLQNPSALAHDKRDIDKPVFSESKNKTHDVSFTDSDIESPILFDSELSGEFLIDDEIDNTKASISSIKNIENLSRTDRINAMQEFNNARRSSMQTKESVLRPRMSARLDAEEDERFSMGIDEKNEIEKSNSHQSEDTFLSYIHKSRKRKSGDLENRLESVSDERGKSSRYKERSITMNIEQDVRRSIDDMSMEGKKSRSEKLDMSDTDQSNRLTLE